MAEEKEKPLTRKDVEKKIEENNGKTGGLDLSGKTFESGIDLHKMNLVAINLNRSHLQGANLSESNLGWAKLSKAYLEGSLLERANLNKATLRNAHLEEADLTDASLKEAYLQSTDFKYAILHGTDFENSNLEGAHLQEARLFRANLKGADLHRAHLSEADLSHANLAGAYWYDAEFDETTKFENAIWGDYQIGEEIKGRFDKAVETYRRLKMWYTHAGYSDIAAKFYYREKEASRKSLRWRSKSSFWHRLALNLSYWVFGHGERWRRVPLSMAVLLLLFAAAYYFGGNLEPLDSLYYSAVSFTALGYGKWALEPIGWVKGLGAFEAFVGVFMMALLLVTFVRKWTR